MKYFLILKLMLISKIGMSQIMLPAYQGVVSKIPAVVTPSFSCGPSTVSDIDGNVYNTVLIGTQCWTKENLRVRKYNDGTAIPLNTVSSVWQGLTTGAYTIYDNEASSGTNATNYGFLYNWYAAKGIITAGGTSTKNICPTGFHVPTDSDWNKLVKFINSLADTTINGLQSSPAGTKLKKNDALWTTNTGNTGTDNYGFSALPGGWRNINGSFYDIKMVAFFW
ncbi:MAG: fibrobacter succinogenes major paralogous domain-containing protein, partial [Bacteroidota bacterium]